MGAKHKIVYFGSNGRDLTERLESEFLLEKAADTDECLQLLNDNDVKLVLLENSGAPEDTLDACQRIHESPGLEELPIVIIGKSESELSLQVRAYEIGCSDILEPDLPENLIIARLNHEIFHRIATEQIQGRLKVASELAFGAMSNSSDLGTNIQFFLGSTHCTNLDELGQLLFQSLNHYGLNASLQMRSLYETKNMEANGMSKQLESELLLRLKDVGRYYDFGKRTVMNYEQVGLLVRNMPLDDEKKYGVIKDNVFSLLQGVDARVKALDNQHALREEHQLLGRLTEHIHAYIDRVDEGYQEVVRDIATVVEDMSDNVTESLLSLGLTEQQEEALEIIMAEGVERTNGVFSQGLKVDVKFRELIERLEHFCEQDCTHMRRGMLHEMIEMLSEEVPSQPKS